MNRSWKYKRLGDVCSLVSGQHIPTKEYNLEEIGIGYLTGPSDFGHTHPFVSKWTEHPRRTALKNDILITVKGSGVGKINLLNHDELAISRQLMAIRTHDVDKNFLYLYLLTQFDYFQGLATGAAIPGISREDVLNVQLPTPSIKEQKRIVAILDEAFEGIATATANAEKNLANARELFESYLNSVFEQDGEKWAETTIGDEVELLPGFAFKSANYTDADDGIKLLRGDNIVQGALRWRGVKKWPSSDVIDYEKFWLSEGDVVLAMDRPWVNAGLKRAIIDPTDLPCLLVQRVARLRCKSRIESRFLFYLVSCSQFTKYLLSGQTGIGVPHISGKQIQSFDFRIPSPERQRVIIQNLDALGKKTTQLAAIYQQKLNDLTELKQSILQKAFSGELTKLAA